MLHLVESQCNVSLLADDPTFETGGHGDFQSKLLHLKCLGKGDTTNRNKCRSLAKPPDKTWCQCSVSFVIIVSFVTGFNCSLFAYGQTGAGKSYSMVGYGNNKLVPLVKVQSVEQVNCELYWILLNFGRAGMMQWWEVNSHLLPMWCPGFCS